MARCAYLGIGAHPDDVELLALPAILKARAEGEAFGAVVLTHGGDSGQGQGGRLDEQRKAAELGGYAELRLLGYSSDDLRGPGRAKLIEDLSCLLGDLQPREVLTHDLSDPHPTHLAASLAVIAALKALPASSRPQRLLGCEVWRSLDWLAREDRVLLPVDDREGLSDRLLQAHASQLAQRPYDRAVKGRRLAQAVFQDRGQAPLPGLALGLDLTPLIQERGPSPKSYMEGMLGRFSAELLGRLEDAEG